MSGYLNDLREPVLILLTAKWQLAGEDFVAWRILEHAINYLNNQRLAQISEVSL